MNNNQENLNLDKDISVYEICNDNISNINLSHNNINNSINPTKLLRNDSNNASKMDYLDSNITSRTKAIKYDMKITNPFDDNRNKMNSNNNNNSNSKRNNNNANKNLKNKIVISDCREFKTGRIN